MHASVAACARMYVCMYVYTPRRASDAFRIRVRCTYGRVARTHTRAQRVERVVRPSRWQRPRERAHWTGVIKQQDNDGDLRGPTANGLTRKFLRGQHARRRERKVERPRARFINLVRATRTQMRLGLGSARLDWTRDDATGPGAQARCGIIYLM